MTDRPTVFIQDAAKIAQVSRRTIYYWLKAGKLDYIRTAGGSVRIYRDSLFTKAERRDAREGQ